MEGMVPDFVDQVELQFHRNFGCLLVTLQLAACSLGEPISQSPAPQAPQESARAVVQSWQSAAMEIPERGTERLRALAASPFELSAPEEARFRSATAEDTARSLDQPAVRAALHTGALIARATSVETRFESSRRGEILATVGGERGYLLTLRRGPSGWKVIRFAPVPRDRAE